MVRRCLTCGRRWREPVPPCGHPQDQHAEPQPAGEAEPLHTQAPPGYRVHGMLGRGGFGTVMFGVRERDDRPVAIKLYHQNSAGAYERLRTEADVLENVGPPYVPTMYDIGTLDDGSPFMICELVELPTLSEKLADWNGPLAPDTFVALADAVLMALDHLHARGFAHLDLKPENIMVREAPIVVRLIDFGLSRRIGPDAPAPVRGPANLALGTPDYMAPEQCQGEAELGKPADIYAIGVVLYEMLTGRPPFFGASAEVREAHVVRRPPAPSRVAEVPDIFDDALLRCLAKEPARRWDSAAELRAALDQAAAAARQPSKPRASSRAQTTQELRAPSTATERLPVGLLFFETSTATGRIQQALGSLGGQLMSVSGSRCVGIFGLEASGNPVQRAYDSAQALIDQALIDRALVDRDRVRMRGRPDGSRRLFSPALLRPDRFPQAGDPAGVLLSREAADALPEVATEPVRDGVVRALARQELTEDGTLSDATIFRMSSGQLIGREQQLQQLLDGARKALREQQPAIATVISEPGYGKSHLCAAALAELRVSIPELEIIYLRAREPLGGESQDTLRALLRATLRPPDEAPADGGRSLVIERLGKAMGEDVWPAVALILGWITSDAPAVRRLAAAPAALRSAATQAAGEALRRLTRDDQAPPVCCVVDDVHFADDTTLDALEYATLAETAAPLWVCVLARPSFERARPAWARRAARSLTVRLPPLERDSARELARLLLQPAENVSRATLAKLVQQTQGNPLLLVELVRGIKRHGLIRRHARGDWYLATDELDKLPDLPRVEWLAERELAALPPELAAHARLVAHMGSDFSIAELEGVLGELESQSLGSMFPLDAHVGVRRLLAHGLLVAHRDGRYGFLHQLIRDQVASATPDEVRQHIHEACFRFYAHALSIPAAERLPRLAQHAAASGAGEIAAALYLDLADLASSRHAYVDAESMYTRALGLLPQDDDESRMRAFTGRGSMRYRLSRFDDALDDLGRARAMAHALGDTNAEIELLLDMATALDWTLDFRKSRDMVEEARALMPTASPSPLLEARLSLALGRVEFRSSQRLQARPFLEQAIAQAEPLGDQGYETLVIALLLLGVVAVAGKQLDVAEVTFARAIALCEERGDKLHLAVALTNRRNLWISQKDVERAAIDGLRSRQIGREIGQAELEYVSAYNLAEIYYYAGDLEAAWPHMRRAVEIEPHNSAKPLSLLLQARLLAFADRRTAARSVLESMRESQNRSRAMGNADALFVESEEVLYTMVELATRETMSREWEELRARAEKVSPPQELAEVIEMMALVALRRGRIAQSRPLLEEALAVCARAPHLIEDRIRRRLASLRG